MDDLQVSTFNQINGKDLINALDLVGQAVIVKDASSRFLHLNAQACSLLNVSVDGARGRTDHDFLPAEQADCIRTLDLEILRSGKGRTFEEEITGPDGSTRVLVTQKYPVALPEFGSGMSLVAVISDVTELRATERVLRTSEEHYRSFVDLHPQIPWTADTTGWVTQVGPGWLEAAGVPPENAFGAGWKASVHADDLKEIDERWRTAVRHKETFDIEYRLVNARDGRYRWFRNRAVPRKDEHNNVVRWYGLLEDIHQLRIAIDALRESEALFRMIADSVPVMMWLSDHNGKATYHSRLWHELTGQTYAEALGSGWSRAVHPDDRARLLEAFERAMVVNAPFRLEYRLRRADGGWSWVIDSGTPRLSPRGELLGYAGSVLDITERRTAELALRESEASIRGVFESSPDCIRMLDLEGQPLLMNKAAREMLGLRPSDPGANQTWQRIFPEAEMPKLMAAFGAAKAGDMSRLEAELVDAQGNHRCLDVITAPVFGTDGMPNRVLAIWRDITDAKSTRVEAEAARRRAEDAAAKLAGVLESTMDCVLGLDRSYHLIYMNGNARRLLRLGEEAIGVCLWDLYPAEANGPFYEHYRGAFKSGEAVSFEEYAPTLKIWVEVHASPTADGLSVFFRDTSARREAEQERFQAQKQIFHMSRHDVLTGLPNRILLRDTLEHHLTSAEPGIALAVLTLDLDGFKAVNDTYGHHAGDVLLREVAERMRMCIGEKDTIARIGGDEFVISMPALVDAEEASEMALRLVATVSRPFDVDGVWVNIGTSIGIAIAPEDGTTVDQITKASDVALYRAKEMGRGTHCRYVKGMDVHLQTRQALMLSLRDALARSQFEVYYQALVSLHSDQVTTCEALLRWHHPDKGMISPVDFIPLAEETGLIVQLGEWVLGQACREAVTWPEEVSVAVNLSAVQFRSGNLVDVIRNALSTSGISASRLQLEITESVLLDEDDKNLRILQEIRHLGVKIAMDDFGTGYSSLGYLRSFPFDKIKVDRSFITDLPHGKESLAIIRAVAGIGRSLGITTTVEGIETKIQLDAINTEGFDEAQGFMFARPLPASQMREFIASHHSKCRSCN